MLSYINVILPPHHNRGGPVRPCVLELVRKAECSPLQNKKKMNKVVVARKVVVAKLFRNNPHVHNIYMKNSVKS